MSDVHPDDAPGPVAPAWASLPTMPWTRTKHDNARNPDAGGSPAGMPAARQSTTYGARSEPAPMDGPTVPVSAPPVSGAPASGSPASAPPVPAPPASVGAVAAVEPAPTDPTPEDPTPDDPTPDDSTPTDLTSTDPAPDEASPTDPAAPPPPDAERMLAAFRWRFDPETLREVVDVAAIEELTEVRRLLTAKLHVTTDNGPRARLLSLRAVVSRILGELDSALADGRLALTYAEATGELRRVAIAQARLAHVLQWRGEYAEADQLFTQANSTELPDRLRAAMHHQAGKCAYDQGRFIEACNHLDRALELRGEEDPDLIAQTELALDAVFRRVAETGWGPYPRSRAEILQVRAPLTATFDEHTRRWGFTDDLGVFRIPPRFTDVQPFREGVAWVQRPGSRSWELIDAGGELLVDRTAGYRGVSDFSDGVAWVSPDGATGWIAIDRANKVLIPAGFDDVRPFRRGRAPVCRGGRWGAVDSAGKVIVPLRYDGFVTALYDGRYVDGFSDEGLAVVALGTYRGVVDHGGRLIVPPVHPVVVIHPVAFLITDPRHRWGALDRRGRPLLEARFASRGDVTEELDRLLSDARPIL